MQDYVLIFRGGLDYKTASPEEIQQSMSKWRQWMEQLAQEGRMGPGNRLTSVGTVLQGEKKQVIDGPYAEGKEIVGGYVIIKAADMDEAVATSKGCPIFDYDGSVEVREVAV